MRVAVEVDRVGGRRFHRLLRDWLARRFPEAGVALCAVEGAAPLPGAVGVLLGLERMIFRRSRETLCDSLPAHEWGGPVTGAPDIVVDLSDRPNPRAGA